MRLRYIFLYFMLMLFISPSSGQSVPSSNIVSRTVLSSDGTWKTVHRVYDNGQLGRICNLPTLRY